MIVKEPQQSPHATAIQLVHACPDDSVRLRLERPAQMPVALDDESEPEPDVCVVPG